MLQLDGAILSFVLAPVTTTNEDTPLTHEILKEESVISAHGHQGVRR